MTMTSVCVRLATTTSITPAAAPPDVVVIIKGVVTTIDDIGVLGVTGWDESLSLDLTQLQHVTCHCHSHQRGAGQGIDFKGTRRLVAEFHDKEVTGCLVELGFLEDVV